MRRHTLILLLALALPCAIGGGLTIAGAVASSARAARREPGRVVVRSVPGAPTQLLGVACGTARTCYAAGFARKLGAFVTIDSGRPSTPSTVGGTATLEAVACGGNTSCEAVGQERSQAAVVVGATAGTPSHPYRVGTGIYVLGGVACSSATDCVAVGADQGVVVAMSQGIPKSVLFDEQAGFFFGIGCETSSVCEAVGDTRINSQGRSSGLLVRIKNGVPQRSGVVERGRMELASIACPEANTCVAVGGFSAPHRPQAVVARVQGGRLGRGRLVSGAWLLSAVACPSARTCFALGNTAYSAHHPARGLIVKIVDGIPGRPQALPDVFDALACPSARTCFAVGTTAKRPYDGLVATIPVHS